MALYSALLQFALENPYLASFAVGAIVFCAVLLSVATMGTAAAAAASFGAALGVGGAAATGAAAAGFFAGTAAGAATFYGLTRNQDNQEKDTSGYEPLYDSNYN